jgi:hypothetical protein
MPLGSGTRLTIRVGAPEEEHTITIGKVLAWLDGVATSPNEKLKKNRLKERLRHEVARRATRVTIRVKQPETEHTVSVWQAPELTRWRRQESEWTKW